jgi:tubulin-specific chaperone A
MASQAELIKALKVKTGSVKRTHKELTMYEKDREKQQAKVDKLKADNADSANIKQAVC